MGKMVKDYVSPYSKEYEYGRYLKDSDIPPMTSTQHQFAKMLFEEDNFNMLSKWGDLDIIYNSIRKHLKP